jgi:prepilin-type N-terminal cleavage/methylation domain-containing protein
MAMEQKKFFVLNHSKGFTLLEVLLSITILSAVAIGMFSFFTNAMKYTTYNQGKTVAINIARGVLAYMERLDFTNLEQYVESKMNNTDNHKSFVYLNASDCLDDNFPLLGDDEQTKLEACEKALSPTINNVKYDETRIHVFLVPYNDSEALDKLQESPLKEFLPASLKEHISKEGEKNLDPEQQKYLPEMQKRLLKIYVIVRWGDRVDDSEWLEGVIADETIR